MTKTNMSQKAEPTQRVGRGEPVVVQGKGERPPENRVGWPSTPEGCQTEPGRATACHARAGSAATMLAPLPGCRTSPALLPGGRRPQTPDGLRLPSGNPSG